MLGNIIKTFRRNILMLTHRFTVRQTFRSGLLCSFYIFSSFSLYLSFLSSSHTVASLSVIYISLSQLPSSPVSVSSFGDLSENRISQVRFRSSRCQCATLNKTLCKINFYVLKQKRDLVKGYRFFFFHFCFSVCNFFSLI